MSATRCPSCQRALALPEALRAAPVRCPACGTTFQAPGPGEGHAGAGPGGAIQGPPTPARPVCRETVAGGLGGVPRRRLLASDAPDRRGRLWGGVAVLLVLLLAGHCGGIILLGSKISSLFVSIAGSILPLDPSPFGVLVVLLLAAVLVLAVAKRPPKPPGDC